MRGRLRVLVALLVLGLGTAAPAYGQEGMGDLESQELVRSLNEKDRLVSLSFTNAPVRSILQIMAQDADLNLIIPESVKGDLPSIELKRVSFKDAFLSVLRQSGIGARVEGDIITLIPQDAMQIVTFRVNYISMNQLIKLITPFLQPGTTQQGQTAGTPSITPDSTSDTLIIRARAPELDTIRRLIAKFDSPDRDPTAERDGPMVVNVIHTDPKLIAPSIAAASSSAGGGGGAAGGASVASGTDQIIITGDSASKKAAKKLLAQLDQPIRRVMVEAAIVSIALSNSDEYGINFQKFAQLGEWATQATGVLASTGSSSSTGTSATGTTATSTVRATDVLGNRGSFSTLQDPTLVTAATQGLLLTTTQHTITMLLKAVQISSDSKILAHPKVMAVNDKPARFQVGSQLGYLTSTTSATATTQNVAFLDIGTILEITPHVLNSGYVMLTVRPEVSNGKVTNGLPSKDTTTMSTDCVIKDGNTLILGGLLQDKVDASVTAIPWLSDIPYLGEIFKQKSRVAGKNEIVVMMTPTIVKDDLTFGLPTRLPSSESARAPYLRGREGGQQWVTRNLRDRNDDR